MYKCRDNEFCDLRVGAVFLRSYFAKVDMTKPFPVRVKVGRFTFQDGTCFPDRKTVVLPPRNVDVQEHPYIFAMVAPIIYYPPFGIERARRRTYQPEQVAV